MGVSYYTYVGPYIKVHNPPKPTTIGIQSCTNIKCKNYKQRSSDQFCSKCGTKIGVVNMPSSDRIHFDFYDEFNDKLAEIRTEYTYRGDYQFFISNKKNLGGGRILNCNNEEELSVNETTITADVQKFKKDLKLEIDRMENVFGMSNVNILWGVITYVC